MEYKCCQVTLTLLLTRTQDESPPNTLPSRDVAFPRHLYSTTKLEMAQPPVSQAARLSWIEVELTLMSSSAVGGTGGSPRVVAEMVSVLSPTPKSLTACKYGICSYQKISTLTFAGRENFIFTGGRGFYDQVMENSSGVNSGRGGIHKGELAAIDRGERPSSNFPPFFFPEEAA